MSEMKTNQEGINLLKSFEGIMDGNPKTVNLDPYLCPAGYWTIGWGHCVRDPKGNMIKGKENKAYAYAAYPNGITLKEAEQLLQKDLEYFEAGVARQIKVPVNINQFSACVSFSFNVGLDEDVDNIAEGFGDSTLLRLINANKFKAASLEFLKWNKVKGTAVDGLTRRRLAEQQLFLKPL